MKKTRSTYLFRAIQKNKVSFFSVAGVAALTISLYLGLHLTSVATMRAADQYFKNQQLETMEVRNMAGFTQQDIEEMLQWEEVDAAAGGYSTMVLMDTEREKLTLQALSLDDTLNVPVVVEGTLPLSSDEVAIEQMLADERGIGVGDELLLEHEGNLETDRFRVTGIINIPLFCCNEITEARGISEKGLGAADYYIGMSEEAFNQDYYQGRYTIARLRNHEMDNYYYFSKKYEKQEAALIDKFEERKPDWVFSGRSGVGDIAVIRPLLEISDNLSNVLTAIFLFVTAVVCYATTFRILSEQKVQIGIQKGQGFHIKEIRRHYVFYNLSCGGAGILFGFLLSLFIEKVVLIVYNRRFWIGEIPLTFAWKEASVISGIILVLFFIIGYFASGKVVKIPTIELIRGETMMKVKPFFFEKWKCYKKQKLYTRVMIKNVLIERERLVTTIVGVVGSMSLLVICFNMKLSYDGFLPKQFKEYYLFENRLVTDTKTGQSEEFEKVLEERNISYTRVQDKAQVMRLNGGSTKACRLIVTKDAEGLQDFMILEDPVTKAHVLAPEEGILVSRKCAEYYGLSAGDTVGNIGA